MPQYSAPWQALLEPAKGPAFASPDVNSAMGYDISPDDSAAMQFQKQFQAATFAATDEGKQMAVDIAKEKLANKMAAALYERKKQLDQQYPELHSISVTPFGTILGAMSNGDAKILYEGTPEEREAAMAKIKAQTAQSAQNAAIASDPDVTKALIAKPGIENAKDQAITNYHNAMPGLEQSRIDMDKARTKVYERQADIEEARLHGDMPAKPMTEAELNEAAFQNATGYKSTDDAGKFMKLQMMQNTPQAQALRDKIATEKAKLQRRGSGKQAGQDANPDFSGALNLNLQGVPKSGAEFAPTSGGLLGNQ